MHSPSSSSLQQQQSRTIWYQLIDYSGNSYEQVAISKAIIPPDYDVIDFLRAIRAENPNIFSSIDIIRVEAYKSKDSFKDWEFPLSVSKLDVLSNYRVIPADVDALIVLIPPNRTIDSELSCFWNSLATVTPDNQNILDFPIYPKFFSEGPKSLYIRESYKDLYEIICENLKLPGRSQLCRMAITGSPGIGKSVFLFYVLWRLSKTETTRTVILNRRKDYGRMSVFQRNGCWTTSDRNDIFNFLLDESTWYLTDNLLDTPGEIIRGTTILVSSPARKYYKEFLKYSKTAPLHYLPVWSLKELRVARRIYSMSQKQVEERYYIAGGIPLFVLEKQYSLNIDIENIIGRLRVKEFDQIVSRVIEGDDDFLYLVFHYDVDSTYTKKSLYIGSAYTTERALERFVRDQEQDLKRFLANAEPIPRLVALRRSLFEGYAHRLLSAGGEFPIRSLNGKKADTLLRLKKREIGRFCSISKCKNSKVYYVPKIPNHPCIGSFIPKVGYFQMALSLDHSLSESKVLNIVKESQENRLYFVVPHAIYKDFPQQSLSSEETKSDSTADIKKHAINSTGSSGSIKKRKITKDGKGALSQVPNQFALSINIE